MTYEQILTPWRITFLHNQLTIKRIHSSTAQTEIGTVDCPYSIPWTVQGLCISMNCIWGTPPVVMKGSRDPFVRSQTFISILISTTPMHLEHFVMHSDAGISVASGQESSTCWSLTISRRKKERICIVAKRCVLEQKLYWQPMKSYMRNRLVPKRMSVTFV